MCDAYQARDQPVRSAARGPPYPGAQEDTWPFTLESLRLPGEGTLTDHRLIHNLVTDHFSKWYQTPADADDDWLTRLYDPAAFRAYTARKAIPTDLSDLLWRATRRPRG